MPSAESPVPVIDGERGPVRDRLTVTTSVALLAVASAAWALVVQDRTGMDMSMAGPSLSAGAAFVGAWAVMMTAMMLPSAMPMIALYATIRRKAAAPQVGVSAAVFTLVYLVAWAATGVPVYLGSLLLAPLTGIGLAYAVAVVLVAAGAYQLSSFKQVCLRACRSPLGFLLGHWRAGRRGSIRLGWSHAVYCLGCCWALMLVLVAAGAMSIAWVLLLAAIVAAEKLLPGGSWIARLTGGALVALGVLVALRPDLVMMLRPGHVM